MVSLHPFSASGLQAASPAEGLALAARLACATTHAECRSMADCLSTKPAANQAAQTALFFGTVAAANGYWMVK